MSAVLLCFLPSWLLGLALVRTFAVRDARGALRQSAIGALFQIVMAAGLGTGVAGMLFVVFLAAGIGQRWTLLAVELLLAAALLFRSARRSRADLSRQSLNEPAASTDAAAMSQPKLWLCLPLLLAFLIALWHWTRFLDLATAAMPHGQWDAWAIWNQRARFLASDDWRAAFAPELAWSHPDYPLLLPGAVAHGWMMIGNETPLVPMLLAIFFPLATVLLLAASIARLKSLSHGLLAGLVLLGCSGFAGVGAMQYADVPQAFFFLATFCLIAHHDHAPPGRRGWLLLAGMAAGLAASTKNEGQAFCVSLILAFLFVGVLWEGPRNAFRESLWLLLGAAPFLALTLAVKLLLAPGNWLLHQRTELTLSQRLFSGQRFQAIARHFWAQFKAFGGFAGGIGAYLLLFYGLAVGIRVSRRERAPLVCLLSLLGTVTSVCLVYLATPFDLEWQLNTSASRLFAQWLPGGIFIYFLWLDVPERQSSETQPAPQPAALVASAAPHLLK